MTNNTEIVAVREDFGPRLQAFCAFLMDPTLPEPLFTDEEAVYVQALLIAGDPLLSMQKRLSDNASHWTGGVDPFAAIDLSHQVEAPRFSTDEEEAQYVEDAEMWEDMLLPTRVSQILHDAGYFTVMALAEAGSATISSIDGLGPKSMTAIELGFQRILDKHGHRLTD